MKKKTLALSLLATIASVGFVMSASAEELQSHTLDSITVEGQSDILPGGMVADNARMGILGNKNIMEIPYSQMTMTQKSIETFADASQPLCNLLTNNPSIRTGTTSPMYTDFAMRGVCMNGNHMLLNGVPSLFYQFTTPPTHIIDRIDIMSGPSGSLNGVSMSNNGVNSGATPAPGTINVTTKKAPDKPVIRYTQTFSGRSNKGEFIDIGKRFGKNNQWGVRVMGEYMDGGLAVRGGEKEEKNIFVNIDHRGNKSTTNIFGGHFDLRVNNAQKWFTFGGKKDVMPSAPDSKNNYDYDGTTKWVHGWLATINHEQKMNDHSAWFFNAGINQRSGNKYNSSSALRFDDLGNFMSSNTLNAQNEAGKNTYVQFGLKGDVKTGKVKHNLSLAVDRAWSKYWNDSHNDYAGSILGNLYTGVIHTHPALPTMRYAAPSWQETNVGITIADSMEFGKANLFFAVNRKHEDFTNLLNGQHIQNNNWAPSYGLSYMPTKNISVYAGHSESMSRGFVVTDKTCGNYGETMDPVKSKQNEIGVKYKSGKILHTLAYFDIEEANRYKDSSFNWYVDDGKNKYRGLEYTINGQLGAKLTLTGGVTWLNAQRDKTAGGSKDGWHVNGVPKWSAVIGAEYKPTDAWGIVGRVNMIDKCYIDSSAAGGKTQISGYTTFDLGVNYKTKINTVPVRLSAMCYNLTNKDYWLGRGGSTTFGLSMPRTFALSATFDI